MRLVNPEKNLYLRTSVRMSFVGEDAPYAPGTLINKTENASNSCNPRASYEKTLRPDEAEICSFLVNECDKGCKMIYQKAPLEGCEWKAHDVRDAFSTNKSVSVEHSLGV
jgi:hypothetical protein